MAAFSRGAENLVNLIVYLLPSLGACSAGLISPIVPLATQLKLVIGDGTRWLQHRWGQFWGWGKGEARDFPPGQRDGATALAA